MFLLIRHIVCSCLLLTFSIGSVPIESDFFKYRQVQHYSNIHPLDDFHQLSSLRKCLRGLTSSYPKSESPYKTNQLDPHHVCFGVEMDQPSIIDLKDDYLNIFSFSGEATALSQLHIDLHSDEPNISFLFSVNDNESYHYEFNEYGAKISMQKPNTTSYITYSWENLEKSYDEFYGNGIIDGMHYQFHKKENYIYIKENTDIKCFDITHPESTSYAYNLFSLHDGNKIDLSSISARHGSLTYNDKQIHYSINDKEQLFIRHNLLKGSIINLDGVQYKVTVNIKDQYFEPIDNNICIEAGLDYRKQDIRKIDFTKNEMPSEAPLLVLNPFKKYINVFGIPVFATEDTPDDKLYHAANILAEYLDNDEDGTVDNSLVVKNMIESNAVMAISSDEDVNYAQLINSNLQPLYVNEIVPNNSSEKADYQFDASLEEVIHLISQHGYANAYPDIFGENKDSEIAQYMDIARGDYFEEIPSSYPSEAWYTYYDTTCSYDCQIAEYFYWALTSILGAQEHPERFKNIQHEWKLNTADKIKNTQHNLYDLLTNPLYKLPSRLPDGDYLNDKKENFTIVK